MNYEVVLQEFKELMLRYNEEFATIEIYEEEDLFFSVIENNRQTANYEYVGTFYTAVFHEILRV